MKYAELKNKNKEELAETLKDLRIKLGKLRFDLSSNTLKDSSQIKKIKLDIARILTTLRSDSKML